MDVTGETEVSELPANVLDALSTTAADAPSVAGQDVAKAVDIDEVRQIVRSRLPLLSESDTSLSTAKFDMASSGSRPKPPENIITAPIDEPSTASAPGETDQTAANPSHDPMTEIPDSSLVSVSSSPHEEPDSANKAESAGTLAHAPTPAAVAQDTQNEPSGQSVRSEQSSHSDAEGQTKADSKTELLPNSAVVQPSSIPEPTAPPKDKRIAALEARKSTLEATLADLTTKRAALIEEFSALPSISTILSHQQGNKPAPESIAPEKPADTSPPPSSSPSSLPSSQPHITRTYTESWDQDNAVLDAAKAVLKRHISLLHDYNEIRDIGLGLMGLIADARGVRIKDVQEEFGIGVKD